MSMEHKAFVFDNIGFETQLKEILLRCLETQEIQELIEFISINLDHLKDPYEGEILTSAWEELIEPKDVHQYGDFALTKFYEPKEDIGLGREWELLQQLLVKEIKDSGNFLLGTPLGQPGNFFDPGKMGAYFQSEAQVKVRFHLIQDLINKKPELEPEFREVFTLLQQAVDQGKGLYITF